MHTTRHYPSLSDFTEEALIEAAQNQWEHVFPMVFADNPAFKGNAEFGTLITGINSPFGNMIFGSKIPDAERTADRITKQLEQAGVPSFWWIGPYVTPANLPDILTSRGWQPGGMPIMIADLDDVERNFSPSVEVLRVDTGERLSDWRHVLMASFDLPIVIAEMFSIPQQDFGDLYIAYVDGKPAAVSAVYNALGIAGIYCVATLEPFRGRGLASAVTAKALLDSKRAGYKIGTLQASKMGHPVYLKLGFRDIAHAPIHMFGLPVS